MQIDASKDYIEHSRLTYNSWLIYALCLSITYGQTEVSLKLINLILCMSEYIKVKNQNQFTILEMFLALALLL